MAYNNPHQPRVVTFADLQRSLSRFLHTKSAKADLYDLWRMGAPIPQNNPRAPEKRVLLPGQFAQWWQIHVVNKMGLAQNYRLFGGKYKPTEDIIYNDQNTFGRPEETN